MKLKKIVALLVVVCFLSIGCGSTQVIEGTEYGFYCG